MIVAKGRRHGHREAPAPVERRVCCPKCGAGTEWRGNPQRPFCSLTCRLIDLGGWLDERYRIAEREDGEDTTDVP